jgi:hypothetical protein
VPWVRFDDQFPIHRKVDGLSDAAYRLHTSAIFWSARNLTDGFVSREDLDGVTARVRTPARFAAECVKRGVWHGARQSCPSEKCPGPVDSDGWVIHDYWEYQPSKAQVTRDRGATARRQAKWRASHNGGSNAVTNAVTNTTPARPGRTTPQPPAADAAGGHAGQHPNCRQCGTNPRGKPPPEPPSDAARHPSARPAADVLAPSGRPARGAAVAAAAALARQGITREDHHA